MRAVLIKNVDNYFRGEGGEKGWLVVVSRVVYIVDVSCKDLLCR